MDFNAAFFQELLLDTSSSDEDDIFRRGTIVLRPRVQNYITRIVDNYSEDEFRQNFRMWPQTFAHILGLIKHKISTEGYERGHHTISAKSQLLMALWYFATPDCYRSICGRFNIGSATALRTVRRVSIALCELAPAIIRWPTEDGRLDDVINGFQQIGFPDTIGSIDGCYIKIPMPKEHGLSYICRKNFPAIILQGVSDHNLKFTHCYIGEVGSAHDARVLKNSEIWAYMNEQGHARFPQNTHIIGDKAYPCLPELLTLYRNNGFLNERRQQNFNLKLSAARSTIERAFGLLQKRFRCLKELLDVRSMEWIPKYILACCVLHNICIMQNDVLDLNPNDVNINNFEVDDRGDGHINVPRERVLLGQQKRNRICNEL